MRPNRFRLAWREVKFPHGASSTHGLSIAKEKGEFVMNKLIRNLILAAVVLAGFAGTSYAGLMSNAPEPLPPGVARG
jgi:hypothetical protein